VTLARLAGGLILLDGNLGHQVLGQLLIMNTNEVAMAVAAAAMAGTTGQRNVVGQIIVRTVVPAVAVRTILNTQEERIDRKMILLEERERALDKRNRRKRRDPPSPEGTPVTGSIRRPRRGSRRAFRDDDV
jgi:hypothetical protein